MKQLLKLSILFCIGGLVYNLIEIMHHGSTHWSMLIVGGLCFLLIGAINELYTFDMALPSQMLISAIIVTAVELITGLIINVVLGWNVWDYSNLPYNLCGQICLLYFNIWFLLSLAGIFLDDWLRYWLFDEERPRYKLL
ncbi:putative ABC transporter permease [Acetanaerobacterium elongatum]|uniref:Putative ABC-transporter type IV n=1 Tax=Acetanaerobacterium elongatum TaxID=258515 RepID=A0A1G9Z4P0_9FIRM|nr:hypothetical protein [Acetanaerobacterium elongatum]SDN15653.1 Putative ABC-transporter type IV [Acetanaerobacterium elongatum]